MIFKFLKFSNPANLAPGCGSLWVASPVTGRSVTSLTTLILRSDAKHRVSKDDPEGPALVRAGTSFETRRLAATLLRTRGAVGSYASPVARRRVARKSRRNPLK